MQNPGIAQPSPRRTSADAKREFALVLILFAAFRMMTLLAFRPGGQVLDHSDFYWYREYAQLTRQGYVPYANLWSQYPPLFPALMIGVWWVSSLLPPWEFPSLWFSLLLGGTFLLFEAGNLILIYAIARRLSNGQNALRSAWFYAVLFTPVYTLTGWFESYPLFFFLLSLYLLLRRRPLWSALATGTGFMIKLVPLTLLPIGLQTPSLKTHVSNRGWRFTVRSSDLSFDFRHMVSYLGMFVVTVVAMGLPFYVLNPRLVWGALIINSVREPWETVWALLEGSFGYGIAPVDMRNVVWDPTALTGSKLPWLWITLAFGLIYLFAYTRRFDWKAPRNIVAFSGFTLMLFFLYSKGYSPQWLGWVLAFVALLMPNLRGAFYAVVTSLLNLVEANVFFTIVPDAHWLLVVTVGLRTLIFVLLAVEYIFVVQPHWLTSTIQKTRRWGLIGLASVLAIGSVPAGARFVNAYFDARYQLSPYQATIETLSTARRPVTETETPVSALILNSYDHQTYDWLFPYLRRDFTFYMLDDYAPPGETVEARTIAKLERIAVSQHDWWLFDNDPSLESSSEAIAVNWLTVHGTILDVRDVDGGRLYHFIVER